MSDLDLKCVNWFNNIFQPLELVVMITLLSSEIKKFQREIDFDAIAFSGMSGALVAPIISYETGIPIIMVRKKEDLK